MLILSLIQILMHFGQKVVFNKIIPDCLVFSLLYNFKYSAPPFIALKSFGAALSFITSLAVYRNRFQPRNATSRTTVPIIFHYMFSLIS